MPQVGFETTIAAGELVMKGYAMKMFEKGVVREIFGHLGRKRKEYGYIFTLIALQYVLLAYSCC
jgi:hypothetical protein